MSATMTIAPVKKSVVVDTDVESAFRLFTDGFDTSIGTSSATAPAGTR